MEIARILTLSTAHITSETADLLDNAENHIDLTIYPKGEYGWFIYISDDIEKVFNVPVDLKKCLVFANHHKCKWLCLDRDGNTTIALPMYIWED